MGAWGPGILQNDLTQDSLVEFAAQIETALSSLPAPSEDSAGRLAAMLGVLMQFSPFSFAADNPEHASIAKAINDYRAYLHEDSAMTAFFDSVIAGEEPRYEMRTFETPLAEALHGTGAPEFMAQKTWASAPPSFFAHQSATEVLRSIVEACVDAVEDDFGSAESVADLCREGLGVGHLALLLILPCIHVESHHFEEWLATYQRVNASREESEYDQCIVAALRYGIARFTD